MLPGAILAAGRSTRMGQSKALLAYPGSGETLVARLVRSLGEGGANPVLVVGRSDDDELRAAVGAIAPSARFIVNPDADAGGQLSSLLVAIDAADLLGAPGILMTPVDVARVSAATVSALLRASRDAPGRIIRAVHSGRHGHPVIFPRAVFDELRRADRAEGAKAVVRAHAAEVIDVDVADAGVLDDIDTPDDYRRAFRDPQ